MRRMRQLNQRDRVGLGWRPELAAGILAHLDRIDVVEVIADDWLYAARADHRALRTLAAQVPLTLHGVSLGLASTVAVDDRRLEPMARLLDVTGAETWSEHLAFVRGGGIEIGHLAAPPRSVTSVDGAAVNLDRARRITGAAPLVENIATLVDPPASTLDEAEWTGRILRQADVRLLLDLHNPMPMRSISAPIRRRCGGDFRSIASPPCISAVGAGSTVRTAGAGCSATTITMPGPVLGLLIELGRLAAQPLTVILERDGRYPPMARLLQQLDAARQALGRVAAR
jgi:uncharacterized protein